LLRLSYCEWANQRGNYKYKPKDKHHTLPFRYSQHKRHPPASPRGCDHTFDFLVPALRDGGSPPADH
jgi:hypothetical protein